MEIYVVRQGDQIDEIAGIYGVPRQAVIFQNQLETPYRLAVRSGTSDPHGGQTRTDKKASDLQQWLCISVHFQMDTAGDSAISHRVICVFLWIFREGGIDPSCC